MFFRKGEKVPRPPAAALLKARAGASFSRVRISRAAAPRAAAGITNRKLCSGSRRVRNRRQASHSGRTPAQKPGRASVALAARRAEALLPVARRGWVGYVTQGYFGASRQ